MMTKEELITQLKGIIEAETENNISSATEELDIDSFTMMLVITYADDELSVQLDMDSLDFDAFTSLDSLSNLILEHQSA